MPRLDGFLWLGAFGISLNGDLAKLSRPGEIERSERRPAGRGGTVGMSGANVFEAAEESFCAREGRGGTCGIDVDILEEVRKIGEAFSSSWGFLSFS